MPVQNVRIIEALKIRFAAFQRIRVLRAPEILWNFRAAH
jgi:hypothetical protein